ncbi:hypothetical protein [Andreprevotia sp. IGB-42]|uniref:hypothetical protein n=1 Tax=Andreprevotia sp. IGB-42 TaxID=2497473 RepID=UPI00135A7B6D|nr:hypothetical protein [Andreprevotia sp. IGB-42]
MSNSVFVPVNRLPVSLEEVRQAIGQAFEELGLEPPEVQLHESKGSPKALGDSIVTVYGKGVHEHCWVSFGEYPAELTGTDTTTHMGDVTTRGSWLFAGVVVLALFEFGGSTAFNDSGELDGQPEYDSLTLRRVIDDGLAAGNLYLAS